MTEAKQTHLWDGGILVAGNPRNPFLGGITFTCSIAFLLTNNRVTVWTFQIAPATRCSKPRWFPFCIPPVSGAPLNCLLQLDKSFGNHSAQTQVGLPWPLPKAPRWNYLQWVRSAEKPPSMDLLFDQLRESLLVCFFFFSLSSWLPKSFPTTN